MNYSTLDTNLNNIIPTSIHYNYQSKDIIYKDTIYSSNKGQSEIDRSGHIQQYTEQVRKDQLANKVNVESETLINQEVGTDNFPNKEENSTRSKPQQLSDNKEINHKTINKSFHEDMLSGHSSNEDGHGSEDHDFVSENQSSYDPSNDDASKHSDVQNVENVVDDDKIENYGDQGMNPPKNLERNPNGRQSANTFENNVPISLSGANFTATAQPESLKPYSSTCSKDTIQSESYHPDLQRDSPKMKGVQLDQLAQYLLQSQKINNQNNKIIPTSNMNQVTSNGDTQKNQVTPTDLSPNMKNLTSAFNLQNIYNASITQSAQNTASVPNIQNQPSFVSRDSRNDISPNSARRTFSFMETDSPYQNFSAPFPSNRNAQSNSTSHNAGGNFLRGTSESNSTHSTDSSRSGMGILLNSAPLTISNTRGLESKKRKRFTDDEDNKIMDSVNRRKNPRSNHIDWEAVAEDCESLSRTKEQLRSRYARMKKRDVLTISTLSKPSNGGETQSTVSPAMLQTPSSCDPVSKRPRLGTESVGSGSVSSVSGGENVTFFATPHGEHSDGSFSNFSDGLGGSCGPANAPNINRGASRRSNSSRSALRRKVVGIQTDSAHDYISQIQKELEESKNLLREAIQTNKEQQRRIENQTEEFRIAQSEFLAQRERYPKALLEYLRKTAQYERQLAAKKLREDSERLGTITPRINGINVQEQWIAGELFIELQREQRELEEQKNLIEQKRKVIQKLKLNIKKDMDMADDQLFELNEQDSVYKLRLSDIKKEEQLLQQKLRQLDIEKRSHIREIKRQRDEDRSRFNGFPTIGPDGRYFLMKLIGRGGFSEVYQAYDVKELRIVACKIHQLNSSWKDSRKENYIKHVLRECQIHKKISHPRVVQMYDTFVYDENTYVTVLEYCSGYDLDMLLKKHSITEKKAQNIISQVFCGLKYLSEPPRKIIHFDLKPANILYCNGEIKITDFGLSKMMEEEDAIELTSQGAGTYWYLPPECFEVQKTPKISSKVDVWSAGVIFYQMLYGKKPFGNELSQREVLQQRVISNAKVVTFPSKPVVSQEAKEFIQLCLTYDQDERPDVEIMYRHKYLRQFSKSR